MKRLPRHRRLRVAQSCCFGTSNNCRRVTGELHPCCVGSNSHAPRRCATPCSARRDPSAMLARMHHASYMYVLSIVRVSPADTRRVVLLIDCKMVLYVVPYLQLVYGRTSIKYGALPIIRQIAGRASRSTQSGFDANSRYRQTTDWRLHSDRDRIHRRLRSNWNSLN